MLSSATVANSPQPIGGFVGNSGFIVGRHRRGRHRHRDLVPPWTRMLEAIARVTDKPVKLVIDHPCSAGIPVRQRRIRRTRRHDARPQGNHEADEGALRTLPGKPAPGARRRTRGNPAGAAATRAPLASAAIDAGGRELELIYLGWAGHPGRPGRARPRPAARCSPADWFPSAAFPRSATAISKAGSARWNNCRNSSCAHVVPGHGPVSGPQARSVDGRLPAGPRREDQGPVRRQLAACSNRWTMPPACLWRLATVCDHCTGRMPASLPATGDRSDLGGDPRSTALAATLMTGVHPECVPPRTIHLIE